MTKLFLMFASINGFLAVGLGAFGAHALESRLSQSLMQTFQTSVQYHMSHSLALFGVALLTLYFPGEKLLRISGFAFLIGIILFSGSLYVLSLSGIRWLGAITPLGGVGFLAGWACLFWFAASHSWNQ